MVSPYVHLRQIGTPTGNPQTGGQLLYIKTDGKVYTKNAAGVEVPFVDESTGQTLTNKTLTNPRVNQILDTDGDPALNVLPNAGTAVNYFEIRNTAAGALSPTIAAVGADSVLNINLAPKGFGQVFVNSVPVLTTTNTQTVTNKTLSTGTLVGAATTDISGAWTTFTPSLTNISLGTGGTASGRYMQFGKSVDFRIRVVLGTGGAMGTNPTVSLPVNASIAIGNPSVMAMFTKSGVNSYLGYGSISATVATLFALNGTSAAAANVSNTYPFTWAANDILEVNGHYEAA